MNMYREAQEALGNKDRRKLENNTYLSKRKNGDIAVRLHNTDVITYHPNGSVTLDSGGWLTVTTKDRMNKYINGLGKYPPRRFAIYSKRGQWNICRWDNDKGDTYWTPIADYADGITIGPRGGIHGGATARDTKQATALKKRIRAYAQLCADAIPFDMPGAGDCFYCSMTTDEGKSLGDSFKNTDHLISHMDEGYIVPSLVWNALKERGFDPQQQLAHGVVFGQTDLEPWKNWAHTETRKAVIKYMARRFGLSMRG